MVWIHGEIFIYIDDMNEDVYITVMNKNDDYMLWNCCEPIRWLMRCIWRCIIMCWEYMISGSNMW